VNVDVVVKLDDVRMLLFSNQHVTNHYILFLLVEFGIGTDDLVKGKRNLVEFRYAVDRANDHLVKVAVD
jgi:hypothetical protein